MNRLTIEYRDPGKLIPAQVNARTHSKKQIEQLARSIQSFGFNNPVLLDSSDQIVAGHGRVLAAISLGIDKVPTVRLDHLSSAQRRAYVLADNKLAELAGWDSQLLALELQGLLELKLDFDIVDTGFEMAEIDLLIDASRDETPQDSAEDFALPPNVPAIAKPGDLWELGDHLVFCGDALDEFSYRVLLGSEKCEMVFTDPPYNVPIRGHARGRSKNDHPDFLMASGEMSSEAFSDFLRVNMRLSAAASRDGAMHFICMDWRHIGELVAASAGIYSEFKNLCVWVKSNGGMGSLYRSQHELVAVFKVGGGKHVNNVELGRHGRSRTNVWHYGGLNAFQKDRDTSLAMHPTVKPTAMVRDAIYDCSKRGGIVLDQFGGAGTTLIAAEHAGRRARLIELDPHYVDITLHRFVQETGLAAVNKWTGQVLECGSSKRTSGKRRGRP